MVTKVDAGAIILAGGRSRRIGSDKSLLPIDGRPIIESICEQLHPVVAEIIISANDPERFAFLGLPVIPDEITDQGPLMGIASALRHANHDRNLIVACDIPKMNLACIYRLFEEIGDNDAIMPKTENGYWEPLFAVYRKSILPALDAVLRTERRKITAICQYARVAVLELEDSTWLWNLNTLDDYSGFIGLSAKNELVNLSCGCDNRRSLTLDSGGA